MDCESATISKKKKKNILFVEKDIIDYSTKKTIIYFIIAVWGISNTLYTTCKSSNFILNSQGEAFHFASVPCEDDCL